MLLSISQMNKSFGAVPILQNVTMTIEDNIRYGLIGVNGAGKSTLLNIITGELSPDEGEVYRSSSLQIGYLKQNTGLERQSTIIEEMRKVFDDVRQAEAEMRNLESELAQISEHDSAEYRRITQEYAKKQAYIESRDGYRMDVKIKTILNGMGFRDKQLETKIATLSGGEKTRLAIARLLLEEPNLLILDEPTNHLDFQTLTWLEEYLCSYRGSVLVVSHDRYFLDKIVGQIFDLERGKVVSYTGNYTAYRRQKAERRIRQKKEYDAQQAEIAKMQEYVDKNLARASTSNSAKSRIKMLENMERIEKPEGDLKQIKLRFDTLKEPYKDVLTLNNLALAVGKEPKVLCEHIDFSLKRKEKVAIIGRNGIGKSTLLKTVLGQISPYCGEYTWGKNTTVSYYEQENLNMNPESRAIDELWDRFPHIPEAQIRKVLGNVLLTQEDVFKKVKVISGGERARLALSVLMLEKSNVMLLDEPTNHLDLASKEVLEQALSEYEGTLLFVSHDRYLLNKLPDKIIEMTENGMIVYEGNYEYYTERKKMMTEHSTADTCKTESEKQKPSAGSFKTKEQRRQEAERKAKIKELEATIAGLEAEIAELQSEMSQEEVYTDYQAMAEKTSALDEKTMRLDDAYQAWETLQEESV